MDAYYTLTIAVTSNAAMTDKVEFNVRSTTKIGQILWFYLARIGKKDLYDKFELRTTQDVVCQSDHTIHEYNLMNGDVLFIGPIA